MMAMAETSSSEPQDEDQPDRRKGPQDRRVAREDRRNLDRVADDPMPRRDPDSAGRRADDGRE